MSDAIADAPDGVHGVLVKLRCTDCGWLHEGAYSRDAVDALDRAMDLSEREIRAALDVIEFADELDRIDRFARGLQLGVITPEDFV